MNQLAITMKHYETLLMVCHICQWIHQFFCLLRLLALFPTGGAPHPRQGTVLSAFAHDQLFFLSKMNLIISCYWWIYVSIVLFPWLLLDSRILVADSLLLSSHLVYHLSSLLSSISPSFWLFDAGLATLPWSFIPTASVRRPSLRHLHEVFCNWDWNKQKPMGFPLEFDTLVSLPIDP